MLDQPASSGSDGETNADLAPSRHAARQQEIHDIGAGNDDDERTEHADERSNNPSLLAHLGKIQIGAGFDEDGRFASRKARVLLLANHGVVAAAPTMQEAYVVAQSVEWTAHILFVARQLGGEHVLSRQVQDTIAANYGVTIARSVVARTDVTRTDVQPGTP